MGGRPAVFLLAVLRMPAHARGVWWGLWAFQALTVAGDVVYDMLMYHFGEEPFPSVADVLYLASYVAVIGALVLLVHRRQPGQDRDTWIDTAILAVAVACVIATVVILPTLADATAPELATLVSLAYPLLDLIVLSVLIRLLVGVDRLNLALALLTLSVVLTLIADVIYNGLAAQAIEEESSGWVEVLYLAAVLMLTAAATAPGARLGFVK